MSPSPHVLAQEPGGKRTAAYGRAGPPVAVTLEMEMFTVRTSAASRQGAVPKPVVTVETRASTQPALFCMYKAWSVGDQARRDSFPQGRSLGCPGGGGTCLLDFLALWRVGSWLLPSED